MLKEYDVIKAVRNLDDKVLKDCKGTILIVYHSDPPAYEIEFVNDEFETLEVLTVGVEDIIQIEP